MKSRSKRAGLDYWDKLDYTIYDSYPDFRKNPGAKILHGDDKKQSIFTAMFHLKKTAILCLAKKVPESRRRFWVENEETTIQIPMYGEIRSLNLGNSVAIVFVRSTQAAGLSETQSDGASSSFSLARWHGIGTAKGTF